MDPVQDDDEAGRRIVAVVHVAMLAAVPLYGAVLWLLRGDRGLSAGAALSPRLPWILLAVGAAEFAAATVIGRNLLRSAGPGAGAPDRVRRFFLIRFAAAEAIAVFGLFAGFRGAPPMQAGVLFAASAAAMLLAAPTRAAWARAYEETRSPRG
ncbi:MAG: hypothetical protein ABI592_16575 [Acidobacteriota bacterium]